MLIALIIVSILLGLTGLALAFFIWAAFDESKRSAELQNERAVLGTRNDQLSTRCNEEMQQNHLHTIKIAELKIERDHYKSQLTLNSVYKPTQKPQSLNLKKSEEIEIWE